MIHDLLESLDEQGKLFGILLKFRNLETRLHPARRCGTTKISLAIHAEYEAIQCTFASFDDVGLVRHIFVGRIDCEEGRNLVGGQVEHSGA